MIRLISLLAITILASACGQTSLNSIAPTEDVKKTPTVSKESKDNLGFEFAGKRYRSKCKLTALGLNGVYETYKEISFYENNHVSPPIMTDIMEVGTFEVKGTRESPILVISSGMDMEEPIVESYEIQDNGRILLPEDKSCAYELVEE